MYMLRSIRTRFMTKLFTWVHGGRDFEAEIKRGHQHGHLGNQSVSTYRYRATFWHKCDEFINSCGFGPTNQRVPQPGRARNQRGAPPSWLMSDSQGRRW